MGGRDADELQVFGGEYGGQQLAVRGSDAVSKAAKLSHPSPAIRLLLPRRTQLRAVLPESDCRTTALPPRAFLVTSAPLLQPRDDPESPGPAADGPERIAVTPPTVGGTRPQVIPAPLLQEERLPSPPPTPPPLHCPPQIEGGYALQGVAQQSGGSGEQFGTGGRAEGGN